MNDIEVRKRLAKALAKAYRERRSASENRGAQPALGTGKIAKLPCPEAKRVPSAFAKKIAEAAARFRQWKGMTTGT
ncbi:MAG: hypothetical protein WB586_17925 [Chthoniobacterales bacterium]